MSDSSWLGFTDFQVDMRANGRISKRCAPQEFSKNQLKNTYLAMSTPENEKTWLENQLDKYIGSLLGLPKTLRKRRYLIAITIILFIFFMTLLFDKSEISKTVFAVKESSEQPKPTPIPTSPFPVPAQANSPTEPALSANPESQPRSHQPPNRDPSVSLKEIVILYKKNCGDRPFDIQSLQSRIESTTKNLRPPITIQLSGALSHQVAEGSGSAALAAARFTICAGDSVGACPEPKLDCNVRCKYSRADSFSGNTLIATHELAGILASGIDDAQRLNSPITEGNLCKTR